MKTKTVIETKVEELPKDYLFTVGSVEGFFINDEESIKKAIEEYGDKFPEMLLGDIHNAFKYMSEQIIEHVSRDMKEIWERMDKLEKQQK